jgi:hypothetical protein
MWTMRPNRLACKPATTARPSSTGLLTKKCELGEVVLPGHVGQRGFWLRAGGVEHQHVKRPQAISHHAYQFGDLLLIGDVGAEGIGDAAVGPDDAGDLKSLCVAAHTVDRDGKAVAGKPLHDRAAQSPRATRDQSDPATCDIHWRSITAARDSPVCARLGDLDRFGGTVVEPLVRSTPTTR